MRGAARPAGWLLRAAFLGSMAATVGACEQGFDPILASDRIFSVYGVLDATADTQWIRVMPVRDTFFTSPGPIDAIVTLENESTGTVVTLRDSLFHHRSPTPDLIADAYVHTFWTTQPIEPGVTYHLTVTRSDGATAKARVPVPRLVDSVTVAISQGTYTRFGARDYLRFDAEQVAMIQVLHDIQDVPGAGKLVQFNGSGAPAADSGIWEFRYLQRYYGFPIEMPPPLNICLEATAFDCEILIVAAGVKWPFDPSFPDQAVGGMDVGSNVENGVGFVGGITRRIVPYERCSWKAPVPTQFGPYYCTLTYDSRSATLTGRVTDQHCAGAPLTTAIVQLTEVTGPYIRTKSTLRGNGAYTIGALVPGETYQYRVSAGSDFIDREGTLTLAPGETLRMDFALPRKENRCPLTPT